MTRRTRVAGVFVVAVLVSVLVPVFAAQAQTATFSEINDAVRSRNFDAARTRPDPLNPNRLVIGFSSGFDPQTFKYRGFTASTSAFFLPSAVDTISFVVDAPEGFYIAKLTYSQTGTGWGARGGTAAGSTQWVVDGHALHIATSSTNPTVRSTADFTGQFLTTIPVSITANLFVFAPPLVGFATAAITSANVVVELLPLPTP